MRGRGAGRGGGSGSRLGRVPSGAGAGVAPWEGTWHQGEVRGGEGRRASRRIWWDWEGGGWWELGRGGERGGEARGRWVGRRGDELERGERELDAWFGFSLVTALCFFFFFLRVRWEVARAWLWLAGCWLASARCAAGRRLGGSPTRTAGRRRAHTAVACRLRQRLRQGPLGRGNGGNAAVAAPMRVKRSRRHSGPARSVDC